MNEITRPTTGRVLGGVCAGIARRYGWDVTLVRIVTVVLALLSSGTIIPVLYLVLWAVLPSAKTGESVAQQLFEKGRGMQDRPSGDPRQSVPQPGTEQYRRQADDLRQEPYPWENDGR